MTARIHACKNPGDSRSQQVGSVACEDDAGPRLRQLHDYIPTCCFTRVHRHLCIVEKEAAYICRYC